MLRSKRQSHQKKNKKFFRVNERIKAPEVMVIDENGSPLGIKSITAALQIAQDKELDLVEVSPKSTPPVCKIQNYGQFLYQQARKAQNQKANLKKILVKVIRISFKIGQHDLILKCEQTKKFLAKGHKVKVEMILKGRERQHLQKALEKVNNFIQSIGDNITLEQPVKIEGGQISSLITLTKSI
jgi:translation initiation factor IF-3